ncbi:uncharacterized protein LOC131248025 [Magnolia sinica]|uniref:uncharacterized protein LOC131248025 n=1 Tax=Magnolia sinica TaxID=86752 RepID=UPI0026582FCA|nr:uncharacterized protein LOC131248025 [Magnolia sinica]
MDFLFDEEESGKCGKHPSQPRNGVCPICLRDRLILLCPDCANVRPCGCCHPSDFLSSSSSSSSFSSAAVDVSKYGSGIGAVGRMSLLIDTEPSFQRSRSAAFQFLRTKSDRKGDGIRPPPPQNRSRSSFLWFLRAEKTKRKVEEVKKTDKLPRSRSVGISCYSDPGEVSGGDVRLKGWGWHFPSPIKVFRQPKTVKVVHERSPLYRG